MMDFRFEFSWVPKHIGGHQGPPYEGMRTTVRWQRHVAESLENGIDVQWKDLDFDSDSQNGNARGELSGHVVVPEAWVTEGELVEFLNGFRVLAVGKIRVST